MKYATIVVWCMAAVFIVSAVALLVGVVLFPVGPVTLLSGDTISLGAGLVRVLLVTLYICAAMAAIGAIGLAISTFTEHSIGAIAAVMILVVTSEVVDTIPQFAVVAPYLPTHWWNSFDALLRTPVDTTTLWHGLLSFAVYAVLFFLIAWARFTSSDVTSWFRRQPGAPRDRPCWQLRLPGEVLFPEFRAAAGAAGVGLPGRGARPGGSCPRWSWAGRRTRPGGSACSRELARDRTA